MKIPRIVYNSGVPKGNRIRVVEIIKKNKELLKNAKELEDESLLDAYRAAIKKAGPLNKLTITW